MKCVAELEASPHSLSRIQEALLVRPLGVGNNLYCTREQD